MLRNACVERALLRRGKRDAQVLRDVPVGEKLELALKQRLVVRRQHCRRGWRVASEPARPTRRDRAPARFAHRARRDTCACPRSVSSRKPRRGPRRALRARGRRRQRAAARRRQNGRQSSCGGGASIAISVRGALAVSGQRNGVGERHPEIAAEARVPDAAGAIAVEGRRQNAVEPGATALSRRRVARGGRGGVGFWQSPMRLRHYTRMAHFSIRRFASSDVPLLRPASVSLRFRSLASGAAAQSAGDAESSRLPRAQARAEARAAAAQRRRRRLALPIEREAIFLRADRLEGTSQKCDRGERQGGTATRGARRCLPTGCATMSRATRSGARAT